MKKYDRGSNCVRSHRRTGILVALAVGLLAAPLALAHSPLVDSNLSDWCIGAFSNTFPGGGRTEDSGVVLQCGNCNSTPALACAVNADCPVGESCINLGGKEEIAWWDNRTDGAVNDLGTVVVTTDAVNLYIAAELWVDPDPVSLPFGEVAFDFRAGGMTTWWDPNGALTTPGACSGSPDRACTSDNDCHFCNLSLEPFPSTRVRTCGSGCDPDIGDVCDVSQTCLNIGLPGAADDVAVFSNPLSLPDVVVVFDFSRWLIGLADAVMVMVDGGGAWVPVAGALYFPAVNPGASGGSGGPPGSVEVAIPWADIAATGFGPASEFTYQIMIARGDLDTDYRPDGAIEDVMSEPVGGTTSTTTDNCPGFGTGNTLCELADGSTDAMIPLAAVPGGEVPFLTVSSGPGSDVTLTWAPSCTTADTDYEIYEGNIATLQGGAYDHDQKVCSTGGATTAVVTPGGTNNYYIVVPTDTLTEGGYGDDSGGGARPVGVTVCRPQLLGTCP
ncbi:MAG: hypothetical protein GY716_15300 [bacterium]|nr:hypothetical protein [bacterium]